MSIDAETNGLWGRPFCIGAQLWEGEELLEQVSYRLPDSLVTDSWVKAHVLPNIKSIPVTHTDYDSFLKSFGQWYLKHRGDDVDVLWHMGHVVEAFLFRELVTRKIIGEFEAPYCPIEVSAYLEMANEQADSVSAYATKHNLVVPESVCAAVHNPLFDATQAYQVWLHLVKYTDA